MRRVALVGAGGQLAHDLKLCWADLHPDDELVGLAHGDVEVESLASVRSALTAVAPQLVINTSAYHRVDEVEDHADRALEVNAVGPRNLSLVCRELDAVLVHLSTDYVYSGAKGRPYVETDPVDPVSVYGASKACGEMLVALTWPRSFIVRSSGLYGVAGSSGKGGNFVETMLRLAESGRPIRVVDDQVLTPTHTRPLAVQIARLVGTDGYGTVHATCQGECSWYEFAAEIFAQAGLRPELSTQSTAESGAKARRPSYSVLENRKLSELGIDQMPNWREALGDYLEARRVRVTPA